MYVDHSVLPLKHVSGSAPEFNNILIALIPSDEESILPVNNVRAKSWVAAPLLILSGRLNSFLTYAANSTATAKPIRCVDLLKVPQELLTLCIQDHLPGVKPPFKEMWT